jgi:acyl carrier protein
MEELIKILEDIKPGIDFNKEENLIEDEILDSFDIVNLVSRLDDEFDVKITPADLIPENFKSAQSIYNLIQQLQD